MARDMENYRAWDRARYQRRKVAIKQRVSLWVEKNRERKNEVCRQWAERNVENRRFHCRLRQAMRKQAVPKWADLDAMKALYKLAKELEAATGVKHHVDHIVPMKSPLVCGLHWEGNLQILPYAENIRKGNRVWPDMPGA